MTRLIRNAKRKEANVPLELQPLLREVRLLSEKVNRLLTLSESSFPFYPAPVRPRPTPQFLSAQEIVDYVRMMGRLEQEHAVVLCLDTKNQLLHAEVVSKGTANVTLVHPRDVFRAAIRHNAVAVVLVHCHPSGDPEPSPEDLRNTQTLAQGAALLGLVLEDHLIVGHDGFVSLRVKCSHLFTR